MFSSVSEHAKAKKSQHESHKAKEYLLTSLSLARETGDEHSDAVIYAHLSNVFNGLCDYHQAEEYLRKAFHIMKEL